MKLPYVKVTIEAPAYEAKAAAEQYSKDRKYEVLSRSKPYPCRESSNVKIYRPLLVLEIVNKDLEA